MKKILLAVLFCLFGFVFAQDVSSKSVFLMQEKAEGTFITIGGSEFGPYAGMSAPPIFSADAKSYIFVMRKGGMPNKDPKENKDNKDNKGGSENWILANGKEYGPFKGDWMHFSQISDDGASWLVSFGAKSPKGEEFVNILNGKVLPVITRIERMEFFKSGFYYLMAMGDTGKGKEITLFTPDGKFGPYEDIRDIAVSADQKSLIYGYRNKTGEYIRIKDKDYGPFNRVNPIYVGEKGAPAAYIGEGKGGSTLFYNDKMIGYDRIDNVFISKDGANVIFVGYRGENAFLNTNGKETAYKWCHMMQFDGGYVYFAQKEGGAAVVVLNGQEIGSYSGINETYVTKKGSWGAVVQKKKGNNMVTLVVINGKEYDGENLRLNETDTGIYFTWLKYGETDEVFLQTLKVAQ